MYYLYSKINRGGGGGGGGAGNVRCTEVVASRRLRY